MEQEKIVYAALLGLGTVGGGVYKVLKSQESETEKKLGTQIKIKKILVRNTEKAAGKLPEEDRGLLTNSWEEILQDPEISIVIELVGGIKAAKTYISEAL